MWFQDGSYNYKNKEGQDLFDSFFSVNFSDGSYVYNNKEGQDSFR